MFYLIEHIATRTKIRRFYYKLRKTFDFLVVLFKTDKWKQNGAGIILPMLSNRKL